MDCREYMSYIQPFLKEELDIKKTKQLLRHIDECDTCRDEMRTQYLVVEGLRRLETGESFDLSREFEEKLEESSAHNRNVFLSKNIVTCLEVMLVGFTALILIMGVI